MPWPPELPQNKKPLPPAKETPRSIALGERLVPYLLRRAKRRTIGLSIDHRGLRVGAPQRASLGEVEALILKHGEWVAQKLDEWGSRQQPEPLQIHDGMQLPLLGGQLQLRLALGSNRVLWNEQNPATPNPTLSPTLSLFLRSPSDAGRILEKALREKARALFAERLTHYAAQLGVSAPPLALSSARTRWGSCSRSSGIRLNWRLLHFPLHVVDYVVAHELAHLREMNHSRRFWSVVEQLYPDYQNARKALKTLAADCPQWQV